MIAECKKCGFKIEIDETLYVTGSKSHFICPRCGANVDITITSNKQYANQTQTDIGVQQQLHTDANNRMNSAANTSPETQSMASGFQQQRQGDIQEKEYVPQPSHEEKSSMTNAEYTEKQSSKVLPIILVIIAILALSSVGVFTFYLPYLKDKKAPREYTIANVMNLRSSKDAGGDYNKVKSLPYGSEVKMYSNDGTWTEVKDAEGQKGFMMSGMLVSKADFLLLNSIFGDQESRENVLTIKCRKAILNYFKNKHYYGKLSPENLKIISPSAKLNSTNQWQIFCRPKGVKPNNVYFARLVNSQSKYTDFIVTIKNIVTNERKTLLFTFDDDETPHFVSENNTAYQGYIVDANLIDNVLYVSYSDEGYGY